MQKICDICRKRAAQLSDLVVVNNRTVEYSYCSECYNNMLKSGKNPHEEAQKRIDRMGLECPVCGASAEEFGKTFLFGCAECYDNMRELALDSALTVQGLKYSPFNLKHTYCMRNTKNIVRNASEASNDGGFRSADECTRQDLVRHNVISSRIRFARNLRGLQFPKHITLTDNRIVDLMNGCAKAAEGVFNARLLPMSQISKLQKKALIERHIISLPLANNAVNGAVIVEREKKFGGMSVMINEEDHIREQCIADGFDLENAYIRICGYDDRILKELPIAYDERLGFLTACPSNLGTGMRASVMLFLPALKRAGAIEDTLKTFKNEFGITVRGVFGEGSDAAYDMYQISNTRTLCVSESETLEQVRQATVRMCYCERVALEKLVKEGHTELLDRISRSYAVMCGAYTLTSQELMKLLTDVKIGVILGILPIKSMEKLNEMIWACTPSALQILTGVNSIEERDRMRAQTVRKILAEAR